MFLFSGRGYWQELIESIVWAHNKIKVAPAIQPRALSITQGRAVFHMEFSNFKQVPSSIRDEIIEKVQGKEK